MSGTFWQKIKRNHLLLMALCCVAPIVLIIGLFAFARGGSSDWVWLIVLLCPMLHILMMRQSQDSEHCPREGEKLYKCPECGLEYKEKRWAEKCEAWCKEHKSCNLEIIKHAVKVEK